MHVMTRASGLKTLARSVGRRSCSSIARQAMHDSRIRKQVLDILQADLQKEMNVMSAVKSASVLRDKSAEALKQFSWDTVADDLKKHAPTLFNILHGCVEVKRRQYCVVSKKKKKTSRVGASKRATDYKKAVKSNRPSNSVVLGVCAAILLRHKNTHMNLLQRLVSLILNAGHASKQVKLFCAKTVIYTKYFINISTSADLHSSPEDAHVSLTQAFSGAVGPAGSPP